MSRPLPVDAIWQLGLVPRQVTIDECAASVGFEFAADVPAAAFNDARADKEKIGCFAAVFFSAIRNHREQIIDFLKSALGYAAGLINLF